MMVRIHALGAYYLGIGAGDHISNATTAFESCSANDPVWHKYREKTVAKPLREQPCDMTKMDADGFGGALSQGQDLRRVCPAH